MGSKDGSDLFKPVFDENQMLRIVYPGFNQYSFFFGKVYFIAGDSGFYFSLLSALPFATSNLISLTLYFMRVKLVTNSSFFY